MIADASSIREVKMWSEERTKIIGKIWGKVAYLTLFKEKKKR